MKLLNRHSYLFLFLLFRCVLSAQTCEPCVNAIHLNDTAIYVISETDTSDYVIGAGKTLCIESTGTFIGTITNNGGVICNKGRFLPKTLAFNSGTIINSRTIKVDSNLSLTPSCTFINNPESIFIVAGDMVLSGGVLNNEGLIHAEGNTENNSGTFINKGIVNCTHLTGSNSIQDYKTGLVNIKNQ